MARQFRTTPTYSAFALGSSLMWGVIEFVALCRSRWGRRARSD